MNQSESDGGVSGRFEKWKDKVFDDPVEIFTMILAIFTALLWWSNRRLWIKVRDAGAVAKTAADTAKMAQTQLNDIAKLLNGRPRQTLGWKTPEEAMAMELEAEGLAKRCT
ncbi:hypothetical protein [Burkholderia ambifaria]|uniref:hypothetical protein n=1 Tax=Burkholderia ambifaria TaxID=152480 RepID=UPI002FE08214